MTNQQGQKSNPQYKIFLKSSKQWLPVEKTDLDNYYRDINAYRRRQQAHGRRICQCIMAGYSERESSRVMDMARNTFVYRRNKVLSQLAAT
mgnify:CR=1 FL=1